MATQSEHTGDLDDLEAQSARHRASFAETIGALRDRLTAESVKDQVKQRVAGVGQDLVSNLERKARDHPLRAVAVGATLAYPAWRLMRNVRAPMLLIGAGVALARGGGSTRHSEAEGLHRPPPVAARSPTSIPQASVEGSAPVRSSGPNLTRRVGKTTERDVGSAQPAASPAAAGWFRSSSGSSGRRTAAVVGERAGVMARSGRDGLIDAVESRPLLVGGLGLLIGAALAASIPPSETESRLLGDASDKLKERARATAAQGFEAARASGEQIVGDVLHEAEEQGLTASDARDAVKRVGEKARAVADRAAEAVLEDPRAGSKRSDV